MADELTQSGSLRGGGGNINVNYRKSNLKTDLAGKTYTAEGFEVTTTPVALPMGKVTTPGAWWAENVGAASDANIIITRDAAGLIEMVELAPGQFETGQLSPTVTAPFVKTAAGTSTFNFCIFDRVI